MYMSIMQLWAFTCYLTHIWTCICPLCNFEKNLRTASSPQYTNRPPEANSSTDFSSKSHTHWWKSCSSQRLISNLFARRLIPFWSVTNILLWSSTGTSPIRRQIKWLCLKVFSSKPIEPYRGCAVHRFVATNGTFGNEARFCGAEGVDGGVAVQCTSEGMCPHIPII